MPTIVGFVDLWVNEVSVHFWRQIKKQETLKINVKYRYNNTDSSPMG